MENRQWKCGAELVVRHLEAQGVKQVFGIPGAKIDRVFDALEDSPIETIVVRHEANAAFMAAAVGRLTGKAGVALVTSGPGCSNLITGLATATSEGDPMVALGGAVRRADGLKLTHQSMDTVNLCRPVTKFSAQVNSGAAISEVMANAFRAAELGRPGAAFVSLPMDIINKPVQGNVLVPREVPEPGCADEQNMEQALTLLRNAQNPVVLLGLMASRPENAEAVRAFLDKARLPVTGTYQAAGVVDSCHFDDFAGRVGLFNNQPGGSVAGRGRSGHLHRLQPHRVRPRVVEWRSGAAHPPYRRAACRYRQQLLPDRRAGGVDPRQLVAADPHHGQSENPSPRGGSAAARGAPAAVATGNAGRRSARQSSSPLAYRARAAGSGARRHDPLRRHGQLPYLDCPLPLQLPRPSGVDLQWSTDHGGGTAVGYRRGAGAAG